MGHLQKCSIACHFFKEFIFKTVQISRVFCRVHSFDRLDWCSLSICSATIFCNEKSCIVFRKWVNHSSRNKRFGIKDDSHAHANDSCLVTLLIMILSDTFQHLEFTKSCCQVYQQLTKETSCGKTISLVLFTKLNHWFVK